MSLIVQKYGGTSVRDLERIANVARRVAARYDEGNRLAVVVSAMAGETDRMIDMAKTVMDPPKEREMDVLISTGEQVSMALLAMTLESMGYAAKSYCGWQIPILTDSAFSSARIESVGKEAITKDMDEGKIIVVAGFQGLDPEGNITTLGRGGSDTSAVALAGALGADLCEIYTDVDGVFTTDPGITRKARKLDRIGHEEMLEMASLGAKVLHIRAVELAMNLRVPLVVRSSLNNSEGTLVTEEDADMEKETVSAVTCNTKEAKVTIAGLKDQPGVAAQVFSRLADANIVVDMIIQNISAQNVTDISFTIPEADLTKTIELCRELKDPLGAKDITGSDDIAKVSVVGAGMRSHSGVASKMFWSLAQEGINIEMISTSEIKISVIVRKKYAELAVRTIHDTFELHTKHVS